MLPGRWADSPDLTAILDGKTFRIQVDDMAAFTHADIRFDRYARIRITPLSVGEFASSADSGKKTPSEEDTKEPAVVDVISWYELIGRQMLESVITDLNATDTAAFLSRKTEISSSPETKKKR